MRMQDRYQQLKYEQLHISAETAVIKLLRF